MKNALFALLTLTLALVLQGCSPHPGSGKWQSVADTQSRFSKLDIQFEGRAELTLTDTAAEIQRCFWSGKTAETIRLQCTQGDDTGLEFNYELTIDANNGDPRATLSESDKQIGVYQKQKQPKT